MPFTARLAAPKPSLSPSLPTSPSPALFFLELVSGSFFPKKRRLLPTASRIPPRPPLLDIDPQRESGEKALRKASFLSAERPDLTTQGRPGAAQEEVL